MCEYYLGVRAGGCKEKDSGDCPFAHGPEELQCTLFQEGHCWHKAHQCKLKHDQPPPPRDTVGCITEENEV